MLEASGRAQTQPICIKCTHVHTHTIQVCCHFTCLNGFFSSALARSPSTVNLKDDYLAKRFSTRGDFCPIRKSWQYMTTFLVTTAWGGVATSIWWVEARDVAKHPSMYQSPNAHSDEVENPDSATT